MVVLCWSVMIAWTGIYAFMKPNIFGVSLFRVTTPVLEAFLTTVESYSSTFWLICLQRQPQSRLTAFWTPQNYDDFPNYLIGAQRLPESFIKDPQSAFLSCRLWLWSERTYTYFWISWKCTPQSGAFFAHMASGVVVLQTMGDVFQDSLGVRSDEVFHRLFVFGVDCSKLVAREEKRFILSLL